MPQSSSNEAFSHKRAETEQSQASALSFIIDQIVNKLQTVTLVKVASVSNAGEVSPVGTVDVMPLVFQVAGDGKTVEHGIIYNIPYLRLQGGTDAIIIDPKVGDIGMCGFCSRDISSVKKNKTASAPPSLRRYDWSDGLYFGGFLNGTPQQYVRFSQSGIEIKTPSEITLEASKVIIRAPIETNSTLQTAGNITTAGEVSATGNVSGAGISLQTHVHSGVEPGNSNTGTPT